MEAVWTSEAMASYPSITRRNDSENLDLNLHRRENLKSRKVNITLRRALGLIFFT